MYKVFVNEKKLILSQHPVAIEKNLRFEDASTLEMAIDLLANTSCTEVAVHCEDIDSLWKKFAKIFKIIEAAGGIVTNQEGKILFIHRLGKWDLPKGKIEKGESIEQAALREVEEETALKDLTLEHFISHTYHIYTERDGKQVLKITHWFKMNYNGTDTPIPQTEEGITEATWKNQSEILTDVFPKTFKNIQLILEESQLLN